MSVLAQTVPLASSSGLVIIVSSITAAIALMIALLRMDKKQ